MKVTSKIFSSPPPPTFNKGQFHMHLPEAVVLELVVTGECDKATPARCKWEKDLNGCVTPYLQTKKHNHKDPKNVQNKYSINVELVWQVSDSNFLFKINEYPVYCQCSCQCFFLLQSSAFSVQSIVIFGFFSHIKSISFFVNLQNS